MNLSSLLMSRYDTHIIACDDMCGIGHTNGKGFRGKNIGYGFMACTQHTGDLIVVMNTSHAAFIALGFPLFRHKRPR